MDNYTKRWEVHYNIILYAFDYCLGRYTCAGSEFIKNVKDNKHLLNEFMVSYMTRSIKSYLQRESRLSSEFSCDVGAHWREFLIWLEELDLNETVDGKPPETAKPIDQKRKPPETPKPKMPVYLYQQ